MNPRDDFPDVKEMAEQLRACADNVSMPVRVQKLITRIADRLSTQAQGEQRRMDQTRTADGRQCNEQSVQSLSDPISEIATAIANRINKDHCNHQLTHDELSDLHGIIQEELLTANAETRPSDSGECPPPAVLADPPSDDLGTIQARRIVSQASTPYVSTSGPLHRIDLPPLAYEAVVSALSQTPAQSDFIPVPRRLLEDIKGDLFGNTIKATADAVEALLEQPSLPAQSDDVRRQIIEECAKVAEANMHSSVMPGHVGKNIAAEIRALQPQPNGGWQDISTAPKDGTEIWLWSPRYFAKPCWGWRSVAGRWLCHQGNSTLEVPEPTNWMPIPAPPLPLESER